MYNSEKQISQLFHHGQVIMLIGNQCKSLFIPGPKIDKEYQILQFTLV